MSYGNRNMGRRPYAKTKNVVYLFLMLGLMLPAHSGLAAADSETVYAHGPGPIELLLFADYFCPPCQAIEPVLETLLPALVPMGVRVTFVDMPFSAKAPLYARYFLYAANASPSIEGVLHARSALNEIARADSVASDPEMIQALKAKAVAFRLFDTRPVMDQWGDLIRQHNVRSTPTCIVIRPGQEAQRYLGSKEIPEAIKALFNELSGER